MTMAQPLNVKGMHRILLILAILVCFSGCGRTAVERDTRPAFVLDESRPFIIELGRGSGMFGLNVVKVEQTGAQLHRIGGAQHEKTALQLSAVDVKNIVDAVNAHRLTAMGCTYADPNIADSTQWVLWIQQRAAEKSIYFITRFPVRSLDLPTTWMRCLPVQA